MYATLDKWSSGEVFKLDTIFDVMFNLGFLLIIIGGIGQIFPYFSSSSYCFLEDPQKYKLAKSYTFLLDILQGLLNTGRSLQLSKKKAFQNMNFLFFLSVF